MSVGERLEALWRRHGGEEGGLGTWRMTEDIVYGSEEGRVLFRDIRAEVAEEYLSWRQEFGEDEADADAREAGADADFSIAARQALNRILQQEYFTFCEACDGYWPKSLEAVTWYKSAFKFKNRSLFSACPACPNNDEVKEAVRDVKVSYLA